jgi:RNA polymerase sigma factor (sigma-70 family)
MAGVKGRELNDSWVAFTLTGSESAFYAIYAHYYHYLNFIGTKKNFPEDKIQDGISDVFLYLWEKRVDLTSIKDYHNYIITAFLRKLYRKSIFSLNDSEVLEDLSLLVSPSVEDLHIQQGMDATVRELVQQYLGRLADKQRHMIYQKFYLGLSYQEIAEANNVSVHTVYNTIYKALDKLKTLVTKEQETFLTMALGLLSIFLLLFFKLQ